MKNNLLIIIVVAAITGGVGFYAGIKYQQSKRSSFFGRFDGRQETGQRFSSGQINRGGFRPVNGEIISVDDQSITVKSQDGSSKIVFLSDSTTITKSSKGKKSDLKVGETVGVFGIENNDGSITAQSVQINPLFRNIDRKNQ